jgi:long-chain fatty acid transport protein
MRKHLIIALLVLGLVPASYATLVTNMNQSAAYLRVLSRNASIDVDAVYYNPAGLTQLKDGWHFGLNNQTVFQTKTVVNEFPFLNSGTYDGKVNVPIFPDVFAVYKKGNLAFSFGFGPAGGGGTADYEKGLPSFEWQFAALPGLIYSMGIPTTKYSADIAFKGSSVYLGFQLNASYAINDMFSAAVGLRYVSAKNTYEGHIENIMVNPTYPALGLTGAMIPAATFFTAIGQPAYAAQMGNKAVDAEQTATGFTPILSLDVKPVKGLNLALKYEFQTNLEFTNKTAKDDVGMFPDGAKTRGDIPAFLSFGAGYEITPQLRATASFNYFFDKNAYFDKTEDETAGREQYINSNSYDLALGLEYDISEMFLISAGYLMTRYDLASGYQSDVGHDLGADSFGGGLRIKLSPKFDIDLAGMYVGYKKDQKSITYITSSGSNLGTYAEKYSRKTFVLAAAVNIHL